MDVTCPEHREKIKPHQAYDWCSQRLIDSSQVNLPVKASGQVSKVQVVFVHQVFQQQVQQTCTHWLYVNVMLHTPIMCTSPWGKKSDRRGRWQDRWCCTPWWPWTHTESIRTSRRTETRTPDSTERQDYKCIRNTFLLILFKSVSRDNPAYFQPNSYTAY